MKIFVAGLEKRSIQKAVVAFKAVQRWSHRIDRAVMKGITFDPATCPKLHKIVLFSDSIDRAKSMLWGTSKSMSEIAYELGFEYPSHFTNLFKSKTGMAPTEYRNRES